MVRVIKLRSGEAYRCASCQILSISQSAVKQHEMDCRKVRRLVEVGEDLLHQEKPRKFKIFCRVCKAEMPNSLKWTGEILLHYAEKRHDAPRRWPFSIFRRSSA